MEIKIPSVGESVYEALVGKWLKKDGEQVKKDEPLCEIETDKITFELSAETDGVLRISTEAGTTVKIGAVIGSVEEAKGAKEEKAAKEKKVPAEAPAKAASAREPSAEEKPSEKEKGEGRTTPSERKKDREAEKAGTGDRGPGTGERRTKEEAAFVKSEEPVEYRARKEPVKEPEKKGRETRIPMTPIRKRIAERLLAAHQQTAMLTSFNEADMTRIRELRAEHGERFQKKHGVKLGLMSFFVKACVEALKDYPALNARIDGDEIVLHNYYDIGIAVSGEKGLVVPVLRDADRLRLWEIEKGIDGFVERIKTNKLALADLEGGTFTITNGGVFGSLMSTPILNPPQSAVLGMHAIQDRPVARDNKVVIRPMMYLSLSYDHRIIDGREAVMFLMKVKEHIEEPEEMLLEG
ncbi:MAG: 2-oxoglutarate dehydrogenase complex dihydrolipoyllysine-residue succinyltransferase [Geobacter sp.]|nr:2-oxoglutarate dehydrogenase complex dihydrolipoyllysine-residue succinyltransferase [Geobacter sp.]